MRLANGRGVSGSVVVSGVRVGVKRNAAVVWAVTGAVSSLDASDVRSVRFQYAAGARSYWHAHDGAQILLLEQGRGRMQIKGQPMRELRPGEPVVLPGGVMHWHGAAPDVAMTHIAIQESLEGPPVTWLEPVSDADYLGRDAG